MCGIAGILSANRNVNLDKEQLYRMLSTLQHRGPDEWGTWISPQMQLGHVRLSIIDVAHGHQPMVNERYALSFNGEIYNHIELRKELEANGIEFNTQSDTEVVLKAFSLWGEQCFSKFNGQFAVLIWDKKKHVLIAARDRYGIRPLYILRHKDNVYFASEMKAFDTIPGFERKYSAPNLFEHGLLWNTLGNETVFQNINSLEPAVYEKFYTNGSISRHKYYSLGENSERLSSLTFNEACEAFNALLTDSVRLRLRSDVPVAAYLSGGIDSSVTSYLTNTINKERFKTFSVAFSDKDFDESSYQKDMVSQIGSEHYEQLISYSSVADNFLEAVYHFERPVFRTAPIPLFLLSKKVLDNNIKVVLTGEAADEILFGYDSFKELKLLDFWSRQPKSKLRPQLLKKLYPHLNHFADSKQYGLMRIFYEDFLQEYDNVLCGSNIRVHNNSILANYLNKDFKISFDKKELINHVDKQLPDNYPNWTLLQKNQYIEMNSILSGYLLSSQGDRMSMAHSVEGRYPFLDHRLVEFAFSLPDEYKLNVFSQKHILRKTFQNKIPDSILKRPKLPYQAPDLKAFLLPDGNLNDIAAEFLSEEKIKEYAVFDPKMVSRFKKKFSRRVPERIGYRDNMLIAFILSTHMALYWSKNPKVKKLDEKIKKVDLTE